MHNVDDRVCMHHVIDRIDDIMGNYDPAAPDNADLRYMYQRLEDFKRELIYNLGVNQRNRHNG